MIAFASVILINDAGCKAKIQRSGVCTTRRGDNSGPDRGQRCIFSGRLECFAVFHAEIEKRGEEFCIIDLGSSNGTTVNGTKVSGETYLRPGDRIVLGGSSEISFDMAGEPQEAEAENSDSAGESVDLPPIADAARQVPGLTSAPAVSSGSNTMMMVAGGAVLVAVVVVVVAGAVYYRSGSSCKAKAAIVKPEPGDTIIEPVEIELETEDSECVAKAVFTIDGEEIASSTEAPFGVTLDPKEHPELADGFDHNLGIVLIDKDGNRMPQTADISLAFETRKTEKPPDKPEVTQQQQTTPGPKGKEVSLIELQEMTNRLVKQFPGSQKYNVSNPEFLQEVKKKSAEYAQEGYFDRASKYRDAINVAYVKDHNLPAALGYALAMSRSKFNPQKQGAEEGLWRMNSEFVASQKYNGVCPTESLSDESQACAAKSSAVYLSALVSSVFDGDVVYSAVAFGKSTQDAAIWKATLPANRSDVWNTVRTAPEREQLVRFFAAGIVAENPQAFGLKRDRRISELFP